MKRTLIAGLALSGLALAGCPAPVGPTSPASSPSPAAESPAPTASAAPSSAPSAAPSAPAFAWTDGEVLQAFDFKGISGLAYDPAKDLIYVADAVQANMTNPRYVLRKFQGSGAYVAQTALVPEGGQAPDAVNGVAFDLRGDPYFTHEFERKWRVYKLYTATVVPASDLPMISVDRAGPSTMSSSGDEIRTAVVSFDPEGDKNIKTGGRLQVGFGERDKAPSALYAIDDPLYPTVRMAFGPSGTLYLAGPTREGGFGFKQVSAKGEVSDVGLTLGALPDVMSAGPDGSLYLIQNQPTGPATVRKVSSSGQVLGESPIKLQNGAYLTTIRGLTFNRQGRAILAGSGFDASGLRLSGLYVVGN